MSSAEVWLTVLAVLLVVLAALLAAAESSVSRVSRLRVNQLAEDSRRGAAALQVVSADSAPFLSVSTFVRVVCESFAAVSVTVVCFDLIDRRWVAVLVAAGVMVVVSFVLVGVSPRTLGRQHAEAVALASAPMLVWLARVLGPLARLLVLLGNAVTPGKGYRDGPFADEAELRDLVDLAGETELIEADERQMLHSVFELGDTVVREVMVPRTDMLVIDHDKTLRQAMSLFLRSGYSRIPVIDDGPDDVRGVLYLKDVTRRVHANPAAATTVPVTDVMRPAHFVPESKPVDDLLREMQQTQNHVAVAVDEYGGTAGLVTIEDILEEIVGEITDEYDREEPGVEQLDGGVVRVRSTMHVDELGELFDLELDDEDVDTVGGLLSKALGRVPIPGARAVVHGLELVAERPAGRRHRIATVLVRQLADGEDVGPDAGADNGDPAHPAAVRPTGSSGGAA
jgi:CBS domain containing-hemolysin-like protein